MRCAGLLLIPLFALACDQEPVAPDITPTFDITNGPAESGIITRGQDVYAVFWADATTGLSVTFGVDNLEFCSGVIDFDFVPVKDANLASGRVVRLQTGMTRASVWGFTTFDCALFTTEEPVASGEAKVQYTDNDVYHWLGSGHNKNAFTFKGTGTLTDADGNPVTLKAHLLTVWDFSTGWGHSVASVSLQ
jgi:hypothetical protein